MFGSRLPFADAGEMPESWPFSAFQNGVRFPGVEERVRVLKELGYDGIGSTKLGAGQGLTDRLDRYDEAGLRLLSFYVGVMFNRCHFLRVENEFRPGGAGAGAGLRHGHLALGAIRPGEAPEPTGFLTRGLRRGSTSRGCESTIGRGRANLAAHESPRLSPKPQIPSKNGLDLALKIAGFRRPRGAWWIPSSFAEK